MSRRRTSLLAAACAAVLTVAAVACTDKQPTQPKADVAQPVAVVAAPMRAPNGSTVCLAYMNKRAEAKVRFDKAIAKAKALAAKKVAEPAADVKVRGELKRRTEKFDALVADACR